MDINYTASFGVPPSPTNSRMAALSTGSNNGAQPNNGMLAALSHLGRETMNNLAAQLRDKGQLDKAEEMYRRTLAMDEATHGMHHRDTIHDRGYLGRVLMLRGSDEGDDQKAAEGRAAVEEALRLLKAPPHSLPDGHRWVVEFSGFLA